MRYRGDIREIDGFPVHWPTQPEAYLGKDGKGTLYWQIGDWVYVNADFVRVQVGNVEWWNGWIKDHQDARDLVEFFEARQ